MTAAIASVDDGTSGAQGLVFGTGNNSSMAERMRIKSNGRVGIGVTDPSEVLDVEGNIFSSGNVYAGGHVTVGGASGPKIISGAGNPNTNSVVAGPGSLYLNTNGGAGATLWVKESGTGGTGWVAK